MSEKIFLNERSSADSLFRKENAQLYTLNKKIIERTREFHGYSAALENPCPMREFCHEYLWHTSMNRVSFFENGRNDKIMSSGCFNVFLLECTFEQYTFLIELLHAEHWCNVTLYVHNATLNFMHNFMALHSMLYAHMPHIHICTYTHLCQHLRESAKRMHLGGMPPITPLCFIGRLIFSSGLLTYIKATHWEHGGVFGGAPRRYIRFDPPLKSWHISCHSKIGLGDFQIYILP